MENTVPELTLLSTLKEDLYKEGCPVVLKAGELMVNPETNCIYARLTIKNIDNRVISSVLIDIHVFDIANNEIEVIRDYQYLDVNANRGDTFGSDSDINIISTKGKTISVAVRKVTFDDDSEWQSGASLLYEAIPQRKTLLEELEDLETVEQYRRDFSEFCAKAEAATALVVPIIYKDLWVCSCGEINHFDEDECHSCKAVFDPQLDMLNNRVQIAANLTAHKKAVAEKAEADRLEAERKAEAERLAKIEAERLAKEEAERIEAARIRKIRAKKIAIAIAIPTVIAAIIFVIVLITYIIPSGKYTEAKSMMESGQYEEAVTAFSALGGFGDSSSMVSEAKFQKAQALLDAKKYDEAISVFKEVESYKDSADKIKECKYQKATSAASENKSDDAIKLFEEISDYKDSAKQASSNYLVKAKSDVSDLAASKKSFEKLSTEDALIMQQIYCDKGKELYSAGDEENALKYFELVTDKTILTQIDAVYYEGALKLIDSGSFDKAMEILTKLGEYSDSANQILRIYYLKAEAQLAAGSYTEAIALYQQAGAYEDSQEKIKLCSYNMAAASMNGGDYLSAIDQFTALGDYSNSAAMVLEAKYQYGAWLLNNGEVLKAYETLYAIKDYSKAYALLVSNSQFYIHVYDVGVGPNPLK